MPETRFNQAVKGCLGVLLDGLALTLAKGFQGQFHRWAFHRARITHNGRP